MPDETATAVTAATVDPTTAALHDAEKLSALAGVVHAAEQTATAAAAAVTAALGKLKGDEAAAAKAFEAVKAEIGQHVRGSHDAHAKAVADADAANAAVETARAALAAYISAPK